MDKNKVQKKSLKKTSKKLQGTKNLKIEEIRFTENVKGAILLASLFTTLDNRKRIGLLDVFFALLFYPSSLQHILASRINQNMAQIVQLKPKFFKKISEYIEQKGMENILMELSATSTIHTRTNTTGSNANKTNKTSSHNIDIQLKSLNLSKEVKQVLEIALRFAQKSSSYYIGLEHILAGLLVVMHDYFKDKYKPILESFGNIRDFIVEIMEDHKKVVEVIRKTESASFKPISAAITTGDQFTTPEFNFLEKYTTDLALSIKGLFGGYDLIYSRDKQVYKLLATLESSTYSNALIVGEHGVGKTFLVYDLAKRFATKQLNFNGTFPTIRKINLAEIVATSKFGIEVEKRLLGVLNEAFGDDNTIIYLENFQHFLMPPARGGLNLANVLIDFLRTNKLPIIAEISEPEFSNMQGYYQNVFDLFNIIELKEPKQKVVFEILKKHLEIAVQSLYILQQVNLTDYYPALRSIIELSKEYVLQGYFPNKAVKILEGVISKKLETVLKDFNELQTIGLRFEKLTNLLQQHIDIGDFKQAEKIDKNLGQIAKQEEAIISNVSQKTIVTVQDVYDYIADITGLPIKLLDTTEIDTLKELEHRLSQYIVGQDHAVKTIAYAVKRGRLGIVDQNRPWASLLFLGPTGVGKTALAKALATILFGDDKEHFIQLDMSEFMEKHSISKLIGSPPGYVGYEEGGYLTERVKKTPFAVVLFDEIEKASVDVLNILLQILEEGRLTDSHGETVSFKHTIIVLTSNIGADKLFSDKVSGFVRGQTVYKDRKSVQEMLLKQLKKKVRPELINRLDDVVVFNPLSDKQAYHILDMILEQLNKILKQKGLYIKLTKKAKDYLIKTGFSVEFGARTLRRVVQKHVESLITDFMLSRNFPKYQEKVNVTLLIDYNKKENCLVLKNK